MLTDFRLLKAVEGADLFLDTEVCFMESREDGVESARSFADSIFGLLSNGASHISTHHGPKNGAGEGNRTLGIQLGKFAVN